VRALIFDTETTGLVGNQLLKLDQQPRVIEFFGQVVERDGTVLDELEFFCDPGVPVTSEITKITGIRPEDVRGQPPFRHFIPRLLELMAQSGAVVAHNLSFDWSMINFEFDRAGCGVVPWPLVRICTVAETEWIKGHRLKLIDLHSELLGEPFSGAHRARTDVEALTRIYVELCKRGDL
jgi:DNA polymerase III epsilon subunit-like protein